MSVLDHLVSCIMPTADRRNFVPQAIRCFLAQDYAERELVILDDGADSVADLVPEDSRIHYVRASQKQKLGAKRNECIKLCRGTLITHWDDDDWSAPHRISYQVQTLMREQAEVCGLRQMLFYDRTTSQNWLYTYPETGRQWLAGGSLLYTRGFWQRNPFPDVQVGEDTRFIWSRSHPRIAVAPDFEFYIATIHSANTSPKICRGPYWSRWPHDLRHTLDTPARPALSENQAHPGRGENTMKLNLGCCDAPLGGFVNVDLVPGAGVDQLADLRQAWPWTDGSVGFIRAWDIIEHLPDKIFTMNEMWRVLQPGGKAEIAVPTTDGSGAFQDPTHVSFWNRRSFLYYEAGNPYRERFANSYGVRAKFRIVQERTDPSMDGPRLTITLEAVKP
jgi:hypothetical protein